MESIEVKGSFREVGRQIGEATRELIEFMQNVMIPDLVRDTFKGDGVAMFSEARRQHQFAQQYWSASCDLLEGMAEGANLVIDALLPISYCEEISVPQAVSGARDRCSTIVIRGSGGWKLGHQEDYWKVFYGKMPIYDLQIDGHVRMVCLNYPGLLPGLSGSLNVAGIAITNDALWPKAGQGICKQARHFRATLAESMPDAIAILQKGPHVLTDHYTVIDGESDLAMSIEVSNPVSSPDEFAMRRIVHDELPVVGESVLAPFLHTNHVQWLNLHEDDPGHPGSYMRLGKLYAESNRMPRKTLKSLAEMLLPRDGILRKMPEKNLTTQENSVTLATTLIDPSERIVEFIRYGLGDLLRHSFRL